MIELSDDQRRALRNESKPLRVVDPDTSETFVLVRAADYARLVAYDDTPWTAEEMDELASQAGDLLDSFGKAP